YPGYACWGRSRRSVTLDLHDPERFLRLAAGADVVVESFRPGVMDRLGIGYEAIAAANPHAVLVSCPGYPAGHRLAGRPAYDALVQATSGQMWEQPGWRPGPVFLHLPLPSMGAMYLVAAGALAGLAARARTGGGQHVRTSLLQGALLFTTQIWQEVERGGAGYHAVMAKTYPPGVRRRGMAPPVDHVGAHPDRIGRGDRGPRRVVDVGPHRADRPSARAQPRGGSGDTRASHPRPPADGRQRDGGGGRREAPDGRADPPPRHAGSCGRAAAGRGRRHRRGPGRGAPGG